MFTLRALSVLLILSYPVTVDCVHTYLDYWTGRSLEIGSMKTGYYSSLNPVPRRCSINQLNRNYSINNNLKGGWGTVLELGLEGNF